jgi:Cof subfamily protein (haloacid dehalogenase superfamily)
MHYQIAAVDIDDTLLGRDHAISAENSRAVARLLAAGVHVVLASGRSHANMLPFHRALGLKGPLISAQGAVVRDAESGEVWLCEPMDVADVRLVTHEGRRRGFAVQHYALDAVWTEGRNRWSDRDQALNADPQRPVADLLAGDLQVVTKVMWISDPDAIAAAAPELQVLCGARLSVVVTHPSYLEFGRSDVTKATGLATVARRLGVPASRVLAFGDGNNDAPMLAWAGLGVAMPHGRPAAHEAARRIAPGGDPETALARAIAHVLDEIDAA